MAAETKIEFTSGFPEELKESVLRATAPFLGLLDREIATLGVQMSDTEEDVEGLAAISVQRRYHKATLWLSSEFFTYDDEEKARTILHELFHVLLDDLTRTARRVILNFVGEEGAASTHILEDLEEMEERVVDGLSRIWGER